MERALLRHVENKLVDAPSADLLQIAVARQSRFWAEVEPAVQARWALVAAAAEVLIAADRVAKEIKDPPATIPALVKAYAEDEEPWCLLDTHHRHLESRWYNFEFATGDSQESLDQLVTKAEEPVYGGRLGTGQALRHPVQQGEAPHRRPASAARHLREEC